jgi:hypothetical protein
MHYFIAAVGLAFALAFGDAAVAADGGWATQHNRYGELGGLPVVGSAHTQPSAREDNIWGGKNHQPTQSKVFQQERWEGLALPPQGERLENDEVESLYQSLLRG